MLYRVQDPKNLGIKLVQTCLVGTCDTGRLIMKRFYCQRTYLCIVAVSDHSTCIVSSEQMKVTLLESAGSIFFVPSLKSLAASF